MKINLNKEWKSIKKRRAKLLKDCIHKAYLGLRYHFTHDKWPIDIKCIIVSEFPPLDSSEEMLVILTLVRKLKKFYVVLSGEYLEIDRKGFKRLRKGLKESEVRFRMKLIITSDTLSISMKDGVITCDYGKQKNKKRNANTKPRARSNKRS